MGTPGRIDRRQFLAAGGSLALSAARPNIVFLFSDDQRWSTIGAWGQEPVSTPNLDRLVKRGVSFQQAHIMGGHQAAVCIATRAMLLTGQTLWRATGNVQAPPAATEASKDYTFLGEHFGSHGYLTHGIGKWHNPPWLFNRSFSSGKAIFFGGMSDHFQTPLLDYSDSGLYSRERTYLSKKHSTEVFAGAAVEFLKRQDGSKPFLLYTAFTAPHDPRTAPPPFDTMYSPDKMPLPRNFLGEHPFDNGDIRVRDELLAPFPRTPQEIRRHIAEYYGMISHLDSQIGRILDTIEAAPWGANTIIVFAGDNGLCIGQHGLMGKQNLYSDSLHVPLILSGPGLQPGERRSSLCYMLDVYPTLCELAGLPVPSSVEGRSLLRGKEREHLYFAYKDIQRAVRTRDWKLISYYVNGTRTLQLFDLKNDPLEMTNLAAEPRLARQRMQLAALLHQEMESTGDPAPAARF